MTVSDAPTFNDSDDVKQYFFNRVVNKKIADSVVTDVTIMDEQAIGGRKFWRYQLEGLPIPLTRHETWIRDDGVQFSIFGCFEHKIDQVINGEVNSSRRVGGSLHHRAQDDRRSAS